MAVPKLISPLLDGYIMGEPISNHHGVRSCPALREDTEERFIVKIISIPATQNQLDALLLSGAFTNEQTAQNYFKELSEDVCKEAATLSRLSKLEGFLPYQSSQTVKMENGIGYDVYLLSPYRHSLEKQMRTDALTHLAAVNLGLDMCAALAVCRKAGYLYANLKPENIYLSDMRGYCIGDLGFISLSSLKYASLPEKYRSNYTAPEITDAYAALNDSLDIYALGLVLYQVFNNGALPPQDTQPMPVPLYADYEMAAIIMKACAPNPQDRWATPEQMGQALVDYMQRNEVNDVPIVPAPVIVEDPEPEEVEDFLTEEENDQELAELLAMIPDEEPPTDDSPISEAEDAEQEESPLEESEEEPAPSDEAVEEANDADSTDDNNDSETEEEITTEEPEEEQELPTDDESLPEATEITESEEDHTEESSQDEPSSDCTEEQEPAYPRTELTEDGVTTEVAEMLAQADELMQMELPEPVVAPDPIDIPIPPPIVLAPETEPEIAEVIEEDVQELADEAPESIEENPPVDEEPAPVEESQPEAPADSEEPQDSMPPKKRKLGGWIAAGMILILLVAAALGGNYYYRNVYLQTIDSMEIIGWHNEIQVYVQSDVDENLLTVVCTDTYGNTFRSPLSNGLASFTALRPGTQYTIQVVISGQHKLLGQTTGSHTTETQTEIRNFTVTPGVEDGSVNLNFTVHGPDSKGWQVEYSAPGIEPKVTYFTGTHLTLTQLTIGANYTFRLIPTDELYLAEGTNVATFTPQKIVYAQDIVVNSYRNGTLEVVWSAPEGTSTTGWLVRCYNDAGYDQEFTTEDSRITISDLDPSTGYTIRITADGMPRSEEIKVSANPINVIDFNAQLLTPWSLKLTWEFDGAAPASGWMLTYTIDDATTISVLCPEAEGIITLQPDCTYSFEVRPVDNLTYFSVPFTYGPVETQYYEGHGVTASDMTLTLYETPTEDLWGIDNLLAQEPANEFTSGAGVTLLIHVSKNYDVTDTPLTTTFVITDRNNTLISAETGVRTWDEMWHKHNCIATLPSTPTTPGRYLLDVYLEDFYIGSVSITII